MKDLYGFELEGLSNLSQIGNTRFFDIKADKESLDRFIKDLELFNKLEEAGLGYWVQDEFIIEKDEEF